MPRPSFSLTLLASFLLIIAILGFTALNGWQMLQNFALQSRGSAALTLDLHSQLQQLNERTVDFERGSRQFLVHDEPLFLESVQRAAADAGDALRAITALLPRSSARAEQWHAVVQSIENGILRAAHDNDNHAWQQQVIKDLQALGALNDQLRGEIQQHLRSHNEQLLNTLDQRRGQLAIQIGVALAAALLLALAGGWWLLRSLRRIERSIADLGENRLKQRIRIKGPADLQRIGRQLDWLRQRLAELEANRNRILRHVSHELKTPLTSLREGIALLGDGVLGQLSTEQREVTSILEHNARALQERIEQLLHYNAVQFDATRLDLSPSPLLPIIREVAAELQLQAQARQIELDISGDTPIVRADASKLRIALSNLLANAIDFSPDRGNIRIEVSAAEDRIIIDCIDEGPGIPIADAERIFDAFFQSDDQKQRAAKGSGLGLAIVREFITAHHGKVSALPRSQGAHFRIELPHGI